MKRYRPAGQEFQFPCPVLELESFETDSAPGRFPLPNGLASDSPEAAPPSLARLTQTEGLVGGTLRKVEIWSAPPGLLLQVAGGSDFYIAPQGEFIQRVETGGNKAPWPQLDREILVGPALVLALALRGVWCLHASAVTCNGRALLFLGESGQGKSTLAAFLASAGHPNSRLVSDDILPVTLDNGLTAWPRFPQLKLPLDAQPGVSLPEKLPVGWICLLEEAESPCLQNLPATLAAQILLRHTAGARLFPPELLARHLRFCAQAAGTIHTARLSYPRRMSALPDVKVILETLC